MGCGGERPFFVERRLLRRLKKYAKSCSSEALEFTLADKLENLFF